MIKCNVCDKEYKSLRTHLRKHKMTASDYRSRFPQFLLEPLDRVFDDLAINSGWCIFRVWECEFYQNQSRINKCFSEMIN